MTKIYTTNISKSGRVTIPKKVRNLLETDKIAFQLIDNQIKIIPIKSVARRLG